jgi:hypothetical protein
MALLFLQGLLRVLSALSSQGPVSEGTNDERRCLSAVEWNLMLEHCPFWENFNGISA